MAVGCRQKLNQWLRVYRQRLTRLVQSLQHPWRYEEQVELDKVLREVKSAILNFKAAVAYDESIVTLLRTGGFDEDLSSIRQLEQHAMQLVTARMMTLEQKQAQVVSLRKKIRQYRLERGEGPAANAICCSV
ncbi:MAG: hypothetical protein OXT67_13705 [Zetaproteobacteria bacterium]|nr:hypothetical protein [Zetaproteobacteria bacterium]